MSCATTQGLIISVMPICLLHCCLYSIMYHHTKHHSQLFPFMSLVNLNVSGGLLYYYCCCRPAAALRRQCHNSNIMQSEYKVVILEPKASVRSLALYLCCNLIANLSITSLGSNSISAPDWVACSGTSSFNYTKCVSDLTHFKRVCVFAFVARASGSRASASASASSSSACFYSRHQICTHAQTHEAREPKSQRVCSTRAAYVAHSPQQTNNPYATRAQTTSTDTNKRANLN